MGRGFLGTFRRFAALQSEDRWLVLCAFAHLLAIDLGLRLFGYRRVATWAVAPSKCDTVERHQLVHAWQYAHALELASNHHFVHARCLHRSLALHRWLHRRGLPSELQIGVKQTSGVLAAHAWVELAGQVVHDSPAAIGEFTRLTDMKDYAQVRASVWAPGEEDSVTTHDGGSLCVNEPT